MLTTIFEVVIFMIMKNVAIFLYFFWNNALKYISSKSFYNYRCILLNCIFIYYFEYKYNIIINGY